MNRASFRKLQGNEIVNVNNKYKGATAGRQGQIKMIQSKILGLVQVEFKGRKTPAIYNYKFLDVVEEETHEEITKEKEEPITVTKIETTADENVDKMIKDGLNDIEPTTEAPEVEEKDEASTSTETGN